MFYGFVCSANPVSAYSANETTCTLTNLWTMLHSASLPFSFLLFLAHSLFLALSLSQPLSASLSLSQPLSTSLNLSLAAFVCSLSEWQKKIGTINFIWNYEVYHGNNHTKPHKFHFCCCCSLLEKIGFSICLVASIIRQFIIKIYLIRCRLQYVVRPMLPFSVLCLHFLTMFVVAVLMFSSTKRLHPFCFSQLKLVAISIFSPYFIHCCTLCQTWCYKNMSFLFSVSIVSCSMTLYAVQMYR